MGHTKPEMLKDLKNELESIRKLEGIREKSFGVFYLKSIPFMHFHDKDGERWADVKTPLGYKKIPISFDALASKRKSFLKEIENAHGVLSKKRGKKK